MGCFHQKVLHIVLMSSSVFVLVTSKILCTSTSQIHTQGICGAEIPRVLQILCGANGYVERQFRKRGDMMRILPKNIEDMSASAFLKIVDATAQLGSHGLMDVFYEKRAGVQELQKRLNYYSTGIACECCYHQCSLKYMQTHYCKGGKGTFLDLF